MLDKTSWQTILQEGKRLGIPENRERALIREYLQSEIIAYLYEQKKAENLSFIGGTSLRILRGLDRFSEDLDFDNLGLSFDEIKALFSFIFKKLEKQGWEIEFELKKTNGSAIGSFKFLKILFALGITKDKNEKMNIKINYTTPKRKPKTQVIILKRFGFLQPVVTNTEEYLLYQKISAVFGRKDTQIRDFYDIAWFLVHNIKMDETLFFDDMEIKTKQELLDKLKHCFSDKIEPDIKEYQRKLLPFLINPENIKYARQFPEILE